MASSSYSGVSLLLLTALIHVVLCGDNIGSTGPRVSSIVFNNPKLLSDFDEDDDGYNVEKQEPPDPQKLGGVIIQDEAKTLAAKIKSLCNDELAAPKMQVRFVLCSALKYNQQLIVFSALMC